MYRLFYCMLDQNPNPNFAAFGQRSELDGLLHQAIQQRLESRFECTLVKMDLNAYHRLQDKIP